MKLYSTHPGGNKGTLLASGSVESIADFINSVRDGYEVGKLSEDDLIDNGGCWLTFPEGWTPEQPYFASTPTETKGGLKTLLQAVEYSVVFDDKVVLDNGEMLL